MLTASMGHPDRVQQLAYLLVVVGTGGELEDSSAVPPTHDGVGPIDVGPTRSGNVQAAGRTEEPAPTLSPGSSRSATTGRWSDPVVLRTAAVRATTSSVCMT